MVEQEFDTDKQKYVDIKEVITKDILTRELKRVLLAGLVTDE